MTDKELIESMAHKNGKRKIICKLREELAELSLALAKIDYAVAAIEPMAYKNGKSKICKLREELAELSLSLAKIDYAVAANEDPISIIENMHEEFVDVEIMMIQYKTLLNQEVYEQKKEEKLEHIKQLLNADV